jgi:DNA topoisomerase-1
MLLPTIIDKGGPGSGRHPEGKAKYNKDTKKWETKDGKELPEHIQSLKIPPAWKGVNFNEDPKATLLVTGKDAAGRSQSIYSDEFMKQSADAKFERISELDSKFEDIQKEVLADVTQKNENAAVDRLIMSTGIRPGSENDTGAKKQAYGATTLLGSHVVGDNADNVRLQFTGKKGVDLDIPVTDKDIAQDLLDRRENAGPNGKIFNTDANSLLDYTKNLDGGGFKTKDFRTLLGTRTAIDAVSSMSRPESSKEYKQSVMRVAKLVSERLGNTPTVALQSYISPVVFADWKMVAAQ